MWFELRAVCSLQSNMCVCLCIPDLMTHDSMATLLSHTTGALQIQRMQTNGLPRGNTPPGKDPRIIKFKFCKTFFVSSQFSLLFYISHPPFDLLIVSLYKKYFVFYNY